VTQTVSAVGAARLEWKRTSTFVRLRPTM